MYACARTPCTSMWLTDNGVFSSPHQRAGLGSTVYPPQDSTCVPLPHTKGQGNTVVTAGSVPCRKPGIAVFTMMPLPSIARSMECAAMAAWFAAASPATYVGCTLRKAPS